MTKPIKHVLDTEKQLASVAYKVALVGVVPETLDDLLARLAVMVRQSLNLLRLDERKTMSASTGAQLQSPPRRRRFYQSVVTVGIYAWIRRSYPLQDNKRELLHQLKPWAFKLTDPERKALFAAVVRYLTGYANDADKQLIASQAKPFIKEEKAMPPTIAELFYFDTKGLPRVFSDDTQGVDPNKTRGEEYQEAYLGAVKNQLLDVQLVNPNDPTVDVIVAATTGLLLLGGHYDPKVFAASLKDVYQDKVIGQTLDGTNKPRTNTKWYAAVLTELRDNLGRNKAKTIDYREFASVGEEVIRGSARISLGDPRFGALVANAVNHYVSGDSIFGPLELPPLSGDEGDDIEIEPDNVRAVAMIYAAHQLEQMRLFDVVDRITEIFMNGVLPVGLDTGGKALDSYYWDSEDRLNQAARYSQFSLVLGVRGGDVSRDVQPNTAFNNLLMRFISSVAEYDRQQRMADLFEQNRGLTLTAEHVRKAGRDLAANASLYGWAYTHFAAQRLKQQVELALNILKQPSIQKAYSADNPWQVIERVAAAEFGAAPNVVRYKTMAEAGKIILDLLAKYAKAFGTTTSANALFSESNPRFAQFTPGDIDQTDRNMLMRQTQYWLAVNGIKDDQIDQLSQPIETPSASSIPTGRQQPNMNGNLDQIRQMVQQGQMPSMDQLQGLLSINGGGTMV